MLSVLSYNVFFGKKINQIGYWIANKEALVDIACFQEFPKSSITSFLGTLPSYYSYTFAGNVIIHGKEFGQLTVYNTHALLYKKNKIVDLGKGSIVERKVYHAIGDRTALSTTFEVAGKLLTITNVHLIWFALNYKRRQQLRTILDNVEQINESSTASIILGDFNYSSKTRNQGLLKLMKQHYYHHASNNLKTHTLSLFISTLMHQLDYIFYKNCTVYNVEVLNVSFSDHFPIQFTIDI